MYRAKSYVSKVVEEAVYMETVLKKDDKIQLIGLCNANQGSNGPLTLISGLRMVIYWAQKETIHIVLCKKIRNRNFVDSFGASSVI